jgi:hypothetical protein
MNTTHKAATFAIKVRVHLLLERGLVEISTTNSNANCNSFLKSLSGNILKDGYGRVDSTTLTEESSHSTTRAFWSDEDYVNVRRNVNLGQILENWGETVGKVKSLK